MRKPDNGRLKCSSGQSYAQIVSQTRISSYFKWILKAAAEFQSLNKSSPSYELYYDNSIRRTNAPTKKGEEEERNILTTFSVRVTTTTILRSFDGVGRVTIYYCCHYLQQKLETVTSCRCVCRLS